MQQKDFGVIQKVCSLKTSNFWLAPPYLSLLILHAGWLWIFLNEKSRSEKREKNFFCKLNIKDGNVFYRDIYTITTIKMFTCSYIKKSLKKCLCAFNKSFSNYQATYQKELYLLFEKSGNFFHRVSIEIGLTPPLLSPVCFHSFSTDLSLPSRTSPLF